MVHPVTEAPSPPPAEPSKGPPPRTVLLIGGVILLAIVLMAVVATVLLRGWDRHGGGPAHVDHVVSGPVNGRSDAQFDLVKGATAVAVQGVDLGDRLYRVTGSDDGDHTPTVADAGNLVQVTSVGNSSAIIVELNRDVTWRIRIVDGASSENLDLRTLKISGVEIIGGAASVDLRLPAAHGSVPVRMSGGINQFAIHRPSGIPVRVRAGGGAGNVTIDGQQHGGVAGGSTFASGGWDTATDKYDVDCTAGVSTVTVD